MANPPNGVVGQHVVYGIHPLIHLGEGVVLNICHLTNRNRVVSRFIRIVESADGP